MYLGSELISGARLTGCCSIEEAVARDKRRQKLKRSIAALEKKLLREKQFNKQVELIGELKRLQFHQFYQIYSTSISQSMISESEKEKSLQDISEKSQSLISLFEKGVAG